MQKKFKIEVDCANCAAKIETAIKALPVLKDAVKTAKKVEPDFEIEL